MPKYAKGQSGNPTGRPRGYRDFIALCRENSDKAVGTLVRALNKPGERVPAAKVLLQYAWGKPIEKTQLVDEEGEAVPSGFDGMSFEQKLLVLKSLK